MDLNISGKKFLITGASRGLGRDMVLSLAAEGAKVAFAARSKEDIDSLCTAIDAQKNGHYGLVLDLEPEQAPRTLIERLRENGFSDLDGIVHNLGGTMNVNDPMCPISDWRRVWRLNLEVAIELNGHFLPLMRKRKWARIVHISSISSMENHGPIPYCSVKAALNAYTRSLGRYVASDGVIVSAILPGAVWTEGGYWDIAEKERPEHVNRYVKERMAIGRLGQPSEISGLVTFMCSDLASFCVGSIIPVDGGQGRGFFGL
jgi:3-oxoacyl-[acyl-carrier protein] reductase